MKTLYFFTFAALSAFPTASFQIHQHGSTPKCHPFSTYHENNKSRKKRVQSVVSETTLLIIPELGATDLAVALASAAVGAVAQIPKINELEEQKKKLEVDLSRAHEALSSSKQELSTKINELEDALFEMDREFEGQTVRQKKKFDATLKNELEALAVKLKNEYEVKAKEIEEQYEKETKLKLDIQEGKLQQSFLQEKVEYIRDNGEKKRNELTKILDDQAKISAANKELEDALIASKQELQILIGNKSSSWFWPFKK